MLFEGLRMNVVLYAVESGEAEKAQALWQNIPPFEEAASEMRRRGLGAIIDFKNGKLYLSAKLAWLLMLSPLTPTISASFFTSP